MKAKHLNFFLLLIITYSGIAQEIHPISTVEAIPQIDDQKLNAALNLRHNFAELIHNSPKLKQGNLADIAEKNRQEIIISDRWGEGSWGNGYYTEEVEHPDITKTRDTLWKHNKNEWINPFASNTSTIGNEESYYSDHPLIWTSARYVLAYIHLYQHDNNVLYKTRVIQGLTYLMSQQVHQPTDSLKHGGFPRIPQRISKHNPTPSNAGYEVEEMHTSIAVRALAEGYMFLNNIGDDSLNNNGEDSLSDKLKTSMEKAWAYFLARKSNIARDGQAVNASSFVAWAVSGLYKVDQKEEYLNYCIDVLDHRISNQYQRADGSWKSGTQSDCSQLSDPVARAQCENYEWHDARSAYHGIILKGMAETYSIIPDHKAPFKQNLRTAIINSINHIIDYNGTTPANDVTNAILNYNAANPNDSISVNSRIHPKYQLILNYHRNDGCYNGLGHCSNGNDTDYLLYYPPYYGGTEILQGLLYSRKHLTFSDNDTNRLNNFINLTMNGIISEYHNKSFEPDKELLTIGLYKSNSFRRLKDKNNIGLFNKTNNLITLFKNNTYNGTFLTENTVNTTLQYEFAISGNFDADEHQEIALYNRNGATCNGNNCPGWISIFDIDDNGDLILTGGIYTGYNDFTAMVSSDIDNDCVDEIILFDKPNQKIVGYENNEYGANSIFNIQIPSSLTFDTISTINIDNDQAKELAFYSSQGVNNNPGIINIFKLNNNQLSQQGQINTGQLGVSEIKSIDYNNDGTEELALHSPLNKTIKIYSNNNHTPIFTGNTPNNMIFSLMEVADFDNDNQEEIALYSDTGGTSNGLTCKGWIAVFKASGTSSLNWTGSVCTLDNGYTSLFNVETNIQNPNCNSPAAPKTLVQSSINTQNNDVILHPNPAKNHVILSFKDTLIKDINVLDQIHLYDIYGKKINYNFSNYKSNGLKLKLNHLSTGVYILSIEIKGRKIEKRIIKQ